MLIKPYTSSNKDNLVDKTSVNELQSMNMNRISPNFYLGTSGWSYKEWIGPFYSKTDKSMLRAYSKVFNTVEIDSTFYRYPSKGMVMGWARYSPEGFVFTAKLPKLITHDKKLVLAQGIEEDMQRFIEVMEPLNLSGKLGCILIQLPPRYSCRPELEDFLKILPTHIRFAVEFRDLSWMRRETWDLLARYRIAYTIVDEPLLPPEAHLTSDIAYYRWHGRGNRPWYDYRYSKEQLTPWIPQLKEIKKHAKKTFGYFNNHYHGYAVENCLQVLDMLGELTSEQIQAKNKISRYLEATARFKAITLASFNQPPNSGLLDLLKDFTDGERLRRASEIPDTQVNIQAVGRKIRATVKNYHITIDQDAQTIEHDCADWEKAKGKRFCKHLNRLVLSLDREKATDLLSRILQERDEWTFKTTSDKT